MRILTALLLLFTALFIHSCKKGNYIGEDEAITADQTATIIKAWLQTQKKDSVATLKLTGQAQWARSITADSNTYRIVPLTQVNTQAFEPGKSLLRYLIIEEKLKAVTKGYVYEVFGNTGDITGKNELITGFAAKTIANRFTGNLAKITLAGRFDQSVDYVDGALYRYNKAIAMPHGGTYTDKAELSEGKIKQSYFDCIDYWMFVVDQSGRIVYVSLYVLHV